MATTRQLVGTRTPARTISPAEAITTAQGLATAAGDVVASAETLPEMKNLLAPACRAYYTLAAISRRRQLAASEREQLLRAVFPVRVALEIAIEHTLRNISAEEVLNVTVSGAFFGNSAKQGVGIRYALASCAPTVHCGGRCYAHDGRDRELQHLFRSVLNWHFGRLYEEGLGPKREFMLRILTPAILGATARARAEAEAARRMGFQRAPRIRFSHIGDMAATPKFSNALAHAIRTADKEVTCVAYTRHPLAGHLDPTLFVLNFSIDRDDDPRRRLAPPTSRLVCSAWDGTVARTAEVNFLEHHVEKISLPSRSGTICPVTARHGEVASCDEARCDVCFSPVRS